MAKKTPAKKVAKKKAPKKASKKQTSKAQIKKQQAELKREIDKLNGKLSPAQRKAAFQLSPKDLIFCNCLLDGLGQRAAYLESRPDTTASIKSLDELASRLKNKPEVSTYLEVMKASAALATGYDRTWKRYALVQVTERALALDPDVDPLSIEILEARVRRELEQRLKYPPPAKKGKKKTPLPAGTTIEIPVEVIAQTKYDGKLVVSSINELNRMDGDHADKNVNIIEETQAERIKRLDAMEDKEEAA